MQTRAVWKTVKHFCETYDLKPSHAYKLLGDLKDTGTVKRIGKTIVVDMTNIEKYIFQEV